MALALDDPSSSLRAEVESHVAGCPSCAEEWLRLRAIDALLVAARPAALPSDFVASTVERVTVANRLVAAPDLSWSQAALICSGGMAVAVMMAAWAMSPAAPAWPEPEVLAAAARAGWHLAGATAGAPLVAAGLEISLALAVAALWFASVIGPRTMLLRRPA
jgi:hypothetical protein